MCSPLDASPGISSTGCRGRLLLPPLPLLLSVDRPLVLAGSAVGSNTCMMCSFQPSAVRHWCGSCRQKDDREDRSAVDPLNCVKQPPGLQARGSSEQQLLSLLEPGAPTVDASPIELKSPLLPSTSSTSAQHSTAKSVQLSW